MFGVMGMGFFEIFKPESVALTALVISVVAVSGLWLGSLKVRGISLGIPGVMFTGLLVARFLGKVEPVGPKLNDQVIDFVRDFGLILFVYAVGVQVGPGFLASLRRRGLPLNLMAASIVLIGAGICLAFTYLIPGMDIKTAVGLFAGGTTNAPALGSASEAIKTLGGADALKQAAQTTLPAFAIAYPFGLMGVILAMVLLRMIFRVDPHEDDEKIKAAESSHKDTPTSMNIQLSNKNFDGIPLNRIPSLKGDSNVVVSRIFSRGTMTIARPDTRVGLGDVLLAVGPEEELEDLRLTVGDESKMDLRAMPSDITTRKILVTHREVLGKTVGELKLPQRLGVTITRVSRTDIEFTAVGDFRLQFGDNVRAVGSAEGLDEAAKELGNSLRELNHPRLLPIFLGIALGVILGSIPVFIPHLPAPVKLGLASGPMIVAIILSRIGRIGSWIWYMPHSASALLREFGIVLFLIAVGLKAGDGFFNALGGPVGVKWLMYGALVTIVPLMVMGLLARTVFKISYLHVCGLLAGSMTSPSLAFTHTMTPSEAPAVSFATVYPLTMIMRVLVAQLLILIFT